MNSSYDSVVMINMRASCFSLLVKIYYFLSRLPLHVPFLLDSPGSRFWKMKQSQEKAKHWFSCLFSGKYKNILRTQWKNPGHCSSSITKTQRSTMWRKNGVSSIIFRLDTQVYQIYSIVGKYTVLCRRTKLWINEANLVIDFTAKFKGKDFRFGLAHLFHIWYFYFVVLYLFFFFRLLFHGYGKGTQKCLQLYKGMQMVDFPAVTNCRVARFRMSLSRWIGGGGGDRQWLGQGRGSGTWNGTGLDWDRLGA